MSKKNTYNHIYDVPMPNDGMWMAFVDNLEDFDLKNSQVLYHCDCGGGSSSGSTATTYTLTFKTQFGETISTRKGLSEGDYITYPTPPEISGYTFTNWSSNLTEMPASNLTITALYSVGEYTLTYVIDGFSSTKILKYQETITLDTPAKSGYRFVEWENMPDDNKMPAHDLTVTAKFELVGFVITFMNEDVVLTSMTVASGVTPTPPADPTKEADAQYTYTFAGWDKEIVPATADTTYYATYTKTVNQYTITFVFDNGEADNVQTLDYGAMPTVPADPEKADTVQYDYTFTGWDKTIETVTGDTTYTAQYSEELRKYAFTLVDDTDSKTVNKEFGYGLTINLLDEIKEQLTAVRGETLANEINDASKYGTTVFTGASSIDDTLVMDENGIYVRYFYTGISYNITFVFDNGDGNVVKSIPYNDEVEYPEDPTKEGYTFSGWDKTYITMPNEAVTATALYNINIYSLYVNDVKTAEIPYGTTITYNDYVTDPEYISNPQKYSFAWADKDGNEITEATTVIKEDLYIYERPVWNQYYVTFKYNPLGWKEEKVVFNYGDMASTAGHEVVMANYSNAQYKYTFTGWDKTLEIVTGNTTYTAQYTQSVIQYAFQVNGEIPPRMLDYGTVISLADEAKAINEEYLDNTKYDVNITDGSGISYTTGATIAISGRTSITISGTPVNYILSLIKEDGTSILDGGRAAEFTMAYKSLISGIIPQANAIAAEDVNLPEPEGYAFSHWNEYTGDTMTMPNSDLTLTAIYSPLGYDLTYYNEDGTVYSAFSITYKDALSDYGAVLTVPEKEGYTGSWDTAIPETMPAHNVDIHMVYTINQYKLAYVLDSNLVSSSMTDYNTTIDLTKASAETGYETSDWVAEDGGTYTTMPAHDVTYTASTSKIPVNVHLEISKDVDEEFELDETIQIAWGEDYNIVEYISGKTNGFNILRPTEIGGYKFVLDSDPIVIKADGTINVEYSASTYEIYGGYEENVEATTVYYNILRYSDVENNLVSDGVINTTLLSAGNMDVNDLTEELKATNTMSFIGTQEDEDAYNDTELDDNDWYDAGNHTVVVFAVPKDFRFTTVQDTTIGSPANFVGDTDYETIKSGYTIDDADYDLILYAKRPQYLIDGATQNWTYFVK